MSVEAITVVLHHSKASGTDLIVLLGIANHSGDGGAWPSIATLAKYARVDERWVRRVIRRLEAGGEITVHLQAGGMADTRNDRRTNRYDVNVRCPDDCDRTTNHRTSDEGVYRPPREDFGINGGVYRTTTGGSTEPDGGVCGPPEPSLEPSIEPASKETPSPTPSAEVPEPERFDEFWDTYDKKRGRKAVEQKWRLALKKPGVTADLLVAAAGAYIEWVRQEGKHPAYTKDPATWLNGEHWTDELPGRAQPRTRVQEHLTLVQQLAAEEAEQSTHPEIGYRQ